MNREAHVVEQSGRLDAIVRAMAVLSHKKSRAAIQSGKVTVGGQVVLDPATMVRAGTRIELIWNAPRPHKTQPHGIRLVYKDRWIMVVDKPAGLLSTPTPAEEEETALTGARMLGRGGGPVKVVHRLDRETSGLILFARGVKTARLLRGAFDAHAIERVYRCVVRGTPEKTSGLVSSMLIRDAGKGRRGSRRGSLRVRAFGDKDPGPMPGRGRLAITRFRVVATAGNHSALEVTLRTGRTHQIRIHLAEIGCPLLGESVYGQIQGAPRQALHSGFMKLEHPVTKEILSWSSPWPSDLTEVSPVGPGWAIK